MFNFCLFGVVANSVAAFFLLLDNDHAFTKLPGVGCCDRDLSCLRGAGVFPTAHDYEATRGDSFSFAQAGVQEFRGREGGGAFPFCPPVLINVAQINRCRPW